jgi:hypothetical protein
MMGGMPAPFAPKPPSAELPYGMKPKKKWNLTMPMKKANWITVRILMGILSLQLCIDR